MTDEFALRDAAKDLLKLYVALDAAKFSSNQPRGERTMRPAPGPRPPAPDAIISMDEELTSRLFEMVSEVRNHIRPTLILTKHGPRLCSFIAFNAQAISELDVAPDLLEEIHDQAKLIAKRVTPPTIDEVANRPEPRQLSQSIIQKLERMGYKQTRDSLRKLAERSQLAHSQGHDVPLITTDVRSGRTTYLITEVLAYITRKEKVNPQVGAQ